MASNYSVTSSQQDPSTCYALCPSQLFFGDSLFISHLSSHQTLISKGHLQRDSYPFIISSCFHIMPDLFTNTNILPLSGVTTHTSFPGTQEFISLTPSRILNSLGKQRISHSYSYQVTRSC